LAFIVRIYHDSRSYECQILPRCYTLPWLGIYSSTRLTIPEDFHFNQHQFQNLNLSILMLLI